MRPTRCDYQQEEDYWRIRHFLRQVSLVKDRHDFAWYWYLNIQRIPLYRRDLDLVAAAHALYESLGFTQFDLLEPWTGEW